jgi:hypothetical protein
MRICDAIDNRSTNALFFKWNHLANSPSSAREAAVRERFEKESSFRNTFCTFGHVTAGGRYHIVDSFLGSRWQSMA